MYERLFAAVTDGGFHRGLADVARQSMLMRVECAFVVHWGLSLDFLEIQSSQGSVYSSQLFWDQRQRWSRMIRWMWSIRFAIENDVL